MENLDKFFVKHGLLFLRIYHLKAAVRAETRTYSAMTADDGFFCFFIEIDRAHNTGVYAFAAAYTLFRFQQNTTSPALLKGMAWTHFHTCGLFATKAHDCD